MTAQHTFFATCARCAEEVLSEELRTLGVAELKADKGGVTFTGSLETAYRACLWSRTASRILMPLATFEATDSDSLYEGTAAIPWNDHMGPRHTLAVSAAGRGGPQLQHTRFVALRVKDAIVDTIRTAQGARPSIDLDRPDLQINVHLRGTRATVSIDLSGQGLHRRGIGREGKGAPLKENLAAALLCMTRWPTLASQGAVLLDPLCGSGTLLIEGAWMAADVAPGLARKRHGFERWPGHDPQLWRRLREEATQRSRAAKTSTVIAYGYDRSPTAVAEARRNIQRAGLAGMVKVEQCDIKDLRTVESPRAEAPRGLLITNPPYGDRLGESGALGPLYETLGDVAKRRFPGWTLAVLTGNKALEKRIGLKSSAHFDAFNGPIKCSLRVYPISTTGVKDEEGPGWRKPGPDAPMLVNRVKKNLKKMRRWAKREDTHCYRVYDADIPEYNVAVDLYDGAVHVHEYAPPRKVPRHKSEQHLRDVQLLLPELLGVGEDDFAIKIKRRAEGGAQYDKVDDLGNLRQVREGDLRFLINLTDYIDTGLFLDGRIHRRMVRSMAAGQDFLNLFAYTCTASVYAAAGGARSTLSVDISSSYLDWGQKNLSLNGFHAPRTHQTVRADVMQWLSKAQRPYGLIFVAPPTYSRSKRTQKTFDVQRDHANLLRLCAQRLTPDGAVIFSNAHQRFELDPQLHQEFKIEEITAQTIPQDFSRRPKIHNTWRLTLG